MAFNAASDLRAGLARIRACSVHPALHQSRSPEEAALWNETIQLCSANARKEHLRWLGRNDLFFLLVYLLNRRHFVADGRKAAWTFARCNEVQHAPNNFLDLWGREQFKTEIITFGLTIQDILNDPEQTFGFFSHTRPIAAGMLKPIKVEFENNEQLKDTFDDILWENPKLDARYASASWSDHAITVKRRGNPKEATIEAWGLVDGQPTSKHFKKLVYDDIVSRDAVSEDMTRKTEREFANSLFLTASDPPIFRYIATFQEIDDATQVLIDRHFGTVRRYPAIDMDGNGVCHSDEKLAWFKANMKPKEFALQLMLDPKQAKENKEIGFKDEWLDWYDELPPRRGMNIYGLVDPAGATPDSNSQFALWIIGLCADKRARILDMLLDKLDLEECWRAIFAAQQKWECLKWGYEKYGMQRDIEHYNYRMNELNYKFNIVPLGGIRRSKDQRIGELIPWYRERKFLFPRKGIIKQRKDGNEVNLVQYFIDREYGMWPFSKNKDLLDGQARICDADLGVVWPKPYGRAWRDDEGYGSIDNASDGSHTFMSE